MIEKINCFFLGTIVKSHGFDGSAIVNLDADHPNHYAKCTAFLIELNQQLIPFIISKINIKQNTAIVKFDTINSESELQLIIGASIYLPLNELPKLEGNDFYFHEIIGFAIRDLKSGKSGSITKLLDMPQQIIAQVFIDEHEVLIPMHKDFIVSVDRKNRLLILDLPEGLIGLYLQ